jgi:hypothetical protein
VQIIEAVRAELQAEICDGDLRVSPMNFHEGRRINSPSLSGLVHGGVSGGAVLLTK